MEEPPSRKRKAHDEGEQGEDEFEKKQALLTRPPLTAHLSVTSFDGPLLDAS